MDYTTLLLTLILTLTVTLVHSEEMAPLEQDLQVIDELDSSYDTTDKQSVPVGRLKDKVKNTGPVPEKPGGLLDGIKKFSSFKPFWSKSNPPNTGTGYSSSTVYAFSYENLLIIVAIKALLAFAIFGGFGFAPFLGRSLEHPETTTLGSLLGTTEDLLFTLAYLNGRPEEGYTCLQRQACLQPARGEDILLASGMLEKAVHIVQSWTSGSISSPHSALYSLEEALDYSYSGGDCRQRYSCNAIPSL